MDNAENRRAKEAKEPTQEEQDVRESGMPGGGRGRRDEVGRSGVYPPGVEGVPPDAEIRMAGSWGGGDYEESGGSELMYRDGQLVGGTSAGPSGEPTIDIHAGGRGAGEPAPAGDTDAAVGEGKDVVDRQELMMRGLPPAGEEGKQRGGGGKKSKGRRGARQRKPRDEGGR